MDLDPPSLIASLVVSSVGFVCFAYGKKMGRIPQLVVGLVLMGFPYFVSGVLAILGIAAGLLFALWFALRRGL